MGIKAALAGASSWQHCARRAVSLRMAASDSHARRFASATSAPFKAQRRPRVLILGTGWGGNAFARGLDKTVYDVRVVSPANHFLFTSFLPSTTVGTLEFRAIQEPIRTIEGLSEYYQAKAIAIDHEQNTVECQDIFVGNQFQLKYDYLVLATGCKSNTFGVPGVEDREGKEVFFLKHLYHARQIRNRVLECFERATNPTLSDTERRRLLSFVVVGGGATSCEFTSELSDFLVNDVARWYPEFKSEIKVTLVEAGRGILSSFDQDLASYYARGLKRRAVDVRVSTGVTAVEDHEIDGHHSTFAKLSDGTELPFGAMIWSAGLQQVKLLGDLDAEAFPRHDRDGRGGSLKINDYLRVDSSTHKGRVFAIGDCAGNKTGPLPPIAVAAEQQGIYLASCFNMHYKSFDVINDQNSELPLPGPVPAPLGKPFSIWPIRLLFPDRDTFKHYHVGSMASLGMGGGVVQMPVDEVLEANEMRVPHWAKSFSKLRGLMASIVWRSVYTSKQLSWQNMILVPMFWFKSLVFGRDISRF